MSAETDYVAKVDELWKRVQTNEESMKEKREILNECDLLMSNDAVTANAFLATKIKLIMHKAGKDIGPLDKIAGELEAEAKKDPNNCDIWICLAEAQLHMDKPEEALSALEFAKSLGPNPEVLCLMSLCHRRKKNKDVHKSLELATEAIKLDAKNGKSWANMGVAYLSLAGHENIVKSQKAFACAMKFGQSKNADVLINYGTVNELLLDFMGALKCYEQAMIITQGWAVAAEHMARVQTKLAKTAERATAIEKIRPKLKKEIIARAKNDGEYVVVEIPADMDDPAQIALCFDKEGNVVAFGVTKTMKAYFRPEKTVLKFQKAPEFSEIEMNGVKIPYHVIEGPKEVEIIGGTTPADVPPVSVTSSLA